MCVCVTVYCNVSRVVSKSPLNPIISPEPVYSQSIRVTLCINWYIISYIGFEVLTAVLIFWYIMPYKLPAWRWFRAWCILRPWRLRRHVSERRFTFNRLHDVISQKTLFFCTLYNNVSIWEGWNRNQTLITWRRRPWHAFYAENIIEQGRASATNGSEE
jgi:hypothetical protein